MKCLNAGGWHPRNRGKLAGGLLRLRFASAPAGTLVLLLALACAPGGLRLDSDAAALPESEFRPGEVWRDTHGSPINAHGGGVLRHQGIYYWFGEIRTGRTFLPDCNKSWGGTRVDVSGVSCYSSTNLYDWHNEGLALSAVPGNPKHDLHPSRVVERPKVIYNQRTAQFVMWLHIDSSDYAAARVGVARSPTPAGPFKYLGSIRPNEGVWPFNISDAEKKAGRSAPLVRDFKRGQMARDMTLFVDDDQQAYLFYSSEENATMHVSALTEDYLRPAGKYARIFIGSSLEAPAVFKHAGKYYLMASGCTAWAPNTAHMAVAESIFGPWKELGNPCVGQDADTTFRSQGTFILSQPQAPHGFILMADRWNQWDLADSRYVWLPLEFDSNERPIVRWQERWSLSDAPARAGVPRTQ